MNNIGNDFICIRNAELNDCIQLAKWWNDGKIMAHAGFPNGLGTTPEEIQSKIEKDSDDSKRRLIIEYKENPIGEMCFYNLGNNIAEIGIKICESDYQEKGLGRVILSLFIRKLFAMGYNKIKLDTDLNNTRAQHVYELLGFKKMKTNMNYWIDQVGEVHSSIDYELLRDEFVDWTTK